MGESVTRAEPAGARAGERPAAAPADAGAWPGGTTSGGTAGVAPYGRPGAAAVAADAVPFPSIAWFARLAELMNANRARHEHLGYVDCTMAFTVTGVARPWSALLRFEEFSCVDVREAGPAELGEADFVLEASLATWRAMLESIAAGGGRPALEQTLNRLSHMGEPLRLLGDDPLKRDLYFRYNQSLQEFVNASAAFRTAFAER